MNALVKKVLECMCEGGVAMAPMTPTLENWVMSWAGKMLTIPKPSIL